MKNHSLFKSGLAEFFGTAILLIAIVGSGIMGTRLFEDNTGTVLLANAIATGVALIALIIIFGRTSGAHFNPAVTLSEFLLKKTAPQKKLKQKMMGRSPQEKNEERRKTAKKSKKWAKKKCMLNRRIPKK